LLTRGALGLNQTDNAIEISVADAPPDEIDTIIELTLDGPASEIAPLALPSDSLTTGKKATASNIFQDSPSHGPDKAIDDDPATRWATDSGTKQVWLEIDLGKPTTFDRIKIAEEFGRVRKFELQYKDGDNWRTFVQGDKIGSDYSKKCDPITARHVRLNILDAADGPTIWEFHLFPPKEQGKNK
jgi:alpha-L-fucosidase